MTARDVMLLAMEQAKMSRADLARALRCERGWVTKTLARGNNLTLKTLESVVQVCGYELQMLLVLPRSRALEARSRMTRQALARRARRGP